MLLGMKGGERCNILKVGSCYSISWSLVGERREQCTQCDSDLCAWESMVSLEVRNIW